MNAVPLWAAARRSISDRCAASVSIERQTKLALHPSANVAGSTGWSAEPNGVLLVTLPNSLVGEYWPLVRP